MKIRHALRLSVATAVVFAGCKGSDTSGPAPIVTDSADAGIDGAASAPKKLCMIADLGGPNDHSFNETTFDGVKQAQAQFGWSYALKESKTSADYQPGVDGFVNAKDCTVIVAPGFLLTDAVKSDAVQHPEQDFQILDTSVDPDLPNVWGQLYATEQSSFLAGYAAASFTKSGKVATFGGLPIPPVEDYMDGFANGVAYYNQQKGKQVEVVGWDVQSQQGLFSNDFNDRTKGRQMGEDLLNQGVDVIFPVAGPLGFGAADAVFVRANGSVVIGVDSDWTVVQPSYRSIILTSVVKRLDVSVLNMVKAYEAGTFKGGTYRGTLSDGQTDITPFNDLDAQISATTKAELAQIRQDIIDGKIKAK